MSEALTWDEGHRLVRDFGNEKWLAHRVRAERQARGWSQADLAAAVHLHQSAISKIEAEQRERGITIRDAIAFSRVFDIPLSELLLPPEALTHAAAWRNFMAAAELRNTIRNVQAKYDHLRDGLWADARASAAFGDRLRQYRREVMAEVEQYLRQAHDEENVHRTVRGERKRRWNDATVEANRPPVVLVIDEIFSEGS